MTRDEFTLEVQRLAKGFNESMTRERLEALYGYLLEVSLEDMREAIDRCLCEPRYPTLERLEAAIDKAINERLEGEAEAHRREAAGAIAEEHVNQVVELIRSPGWQMYDHDVHSRAEAEKLAAQRKQLEREKKLIELRQQAKAILEAEAAKLEKDA